MAFDFNRIRLPNYGKPVKMTRVVEKIIKQSGNLPTPPTNYQEEAVRRFRSWLHDNGPPLTIKEKRRLSWALNMGERKILADIYETSAVMSFFQQNTMTSGMLKGLIHSYFFADDVQENVVLLRDRIRLLLLQYQGRSLAIHHWAGLANEVFGNNPVESIVNIILNRQNITFYETLKNLKIPANSSFYYRCIEQLTLYYSSDPAFPHRLSELFKVIEATNDTQILKKCLDYVLQGFVHKDIKEPHDQCRSFCIKHLQDPRLRRNVKWHGISKSSIGLVVRWLSTEDLHIFFDLVAMDRDRKNFWLKYVDIIEYSRVILGQESLNLGAVEIKNFLSQMRHAELRKSLKSLSAFVLKIKDAVIVEFSHIGNACYIYRSDNVPFELDTSVYTKKDLADMYIVDDRLIHTKGWEDRFRAYLFENYNISQSGRYWL